MTNEQTILPTLESLSANEVNDLIAVNVMGWHKDRNNSTGAEYWVDEHGVFARYTRNRVNDKTFNPYADLNDCHLAEEKLDLKQRFAYLDQLAIAERGNDFYERAAVTAPHVLRLICATAAQKCKALLLAIGAIKQ